MKEENFERDNIEVVSVNSSSLSEQTDNYESKYFVAYQRNSIKHSRRHSENTMDDLHDGSIVMKNIKMKDYFDDSGDQNNHRNSTPKESLNNNPLHNDSTFDVPLSSIGNSMRKTTPSSNSNFTDLEITNKNGKFAVIHEEKESPAEFSAKRIRSKTQPNSKKINEQAINENLRDNNSNSPSGNGFSRRESKVSASTERESQVIMIKSKKKKSDFDQMELRENDVFEEVYSESMLDSDEDKSDISRRKTPAPDVKPKSTFSKKSLNYEGLEIEGMEGGEYHNVDLKIIVNEAII